jgi:LacI family transcriptional regulator
VAQERRNNGGVTVFDVAEHAGVSIATVSRALSGTRSVSEELRTRVQDSARTLGYQVNLVGRALRQKKTSTLGLIIPDLENPFFSSLAQRISRRFGESEVDVLIASADNEKAQEKRAVQSFLGRQVDALVMIPTDEVESEEALLLASEYVPTIQFDRQVPHLPIPYIGCDNAAGMDLVGAYLDTSVDTSRQPVILVGGGESSSSGRERSSEFLTAQSPVLHLEGSFSFSWGQKAAKQILKRGFQTATIVTGADVIALGVISWLTSAGHKIPEDFRVIGFDDVGVAQLSHPTLTTVCQPVEEMTEAIKRLMQEATASPTQTSQRFAPELIVRASG